MERQGQLENRQNGKGNFGTFLAGSIIGGLSAAAMMLLYAPRSGTETQEQLRERADELRIDAENAVENTRHAAEDSFASGLKSIAGKLGKIASTLDRQATEIRSS